MLTEAYTDIKGTMQYYGDDTKPGSQMPFNFGFISDLNSDSSARDLKNIVDRWITYMPLDKSANWVVRILNFDTVKTSKRFIIVVVHFFINLIIQF